MSNNREAALMQALKSIEKQYGKGSVMKLGEKTDTRIEVVSSGSLALRFCFRCRWISTWTCCRNLWTRKFR